MQQRLVKVNFCNSRVRESPAGRQQLKPRPEPLTSPVRDQCAPRGPGRTKSREGSAGDRPGAKPSATTAPQYPSASGKSGLARRPPSTPSHWPRWPRSHPPHLRVRRHPAGADSGTASGALPGHSAGPRGRARPGARRARAWRPRAGRRPQQPGLGGGQRDGVPEPAPGTVEANPQGLLFNPGALLSPAS